MRPGRSIWQWASRILLGYQVLIAAAALALGAWIASAAACAAQCRGAPEGPLVAGLVGVFGFVWMAEALVAGVAVLVLFLLTSAWASRGAAITNIIVEGLLIFPAVTFFNLTGLLGFPGPGRFALAAAVGAAFVIVGLSALELIAPSVQLTSQRLAAISFLVAIPFAGASIPVLTGAYSSSRISSDGFPVGPVTAQYVQARGSKLPLLYPGSVVRYTAAAAETKTFNSYRMASWSEILRKDGRSADAKAWYQRVLGDAGYRQIFCKPGGCPDDYVMVFVKGSRECLSVLVTNDGVGDIRLDYQIAPSAKPLTGDPTADHRYCTGQY